MKKNTIVFGILMAIILGWAGFSSAQIAPAAKDLPAINLPAQITSPADCFDYYKFQSVQVSLGADKDTYKPGETIKFKGELINQNNYPVVDGYVFVRIGRKNPNYITEGNFTIDELIPIKDINLDANEKKETAFEWTVPTNAAAGDYRSDFFFSVGKKFNLGGLPFTNEVVVGGTEFKITSNNNLYLSFDKSVTKINGEKYNHIGNWPLIEPNAKVDITQPLKNTYKIEQKVIVQYDLYFWDSLNEKDKITSSQEEIIIPANSSTDLTYTVPEMKDSVYLLKITATAQDQKSIANIRLTSDQAHPKINYPAITKFPLQKGDNETIFSCFYNAAPSNASGQISVVLEDNKGNQLEKMEYNGDISGAMMADKKEFTAQKGYSWIKLTAILKDKDGKITDQYETIYDCAKINSSDCQRQLVDNKIKEDKAVAAAGQKAYTKKMAIIVVLILLLISSGIIIWKKGNISNRMFKLLILLVIGGSFFLLTPEAEAYNDKEITTSTAYENTPWYCLGYEEFVKASGDASVLHRVKMIRGNYSVDKGEQIEFQYSPDLPFFTGTGGSFFDTPYGAWCQNLNSACGGTWLTAVTVYSLRGPIPFMADYTAIKPIVTMRSSNNEIMTCNGMICSALKNGNVTLFADISPTNGKLWKIIQGLWVVTQCGSVNLNLPGATLSWNITVNAGDNTLRSCTGADPDNSMLCPNDNLGLAVDTPKTLVDRCNASVKCEYVCSAPYIYQDGACVLNQNIPSAKYKCVGNTCVRDDTNGTFANNNCDNACRAKPWKEVAP